MTYHCDQYFESLKSALYFWSGTSIIVFAVYWILAGIFTIIDITKQPAALGRYKVQPGTNEQVDSKRLMKVCTECVYLKPVYLNTNIQLLVLEMTLDGLMGHWSCPLSLSASLTAFQIAYSMFCNSNDTSYNVSRNFKNGLFCIHTFNYELWDNFLGKSTI